MTNGEKLINAEELRDVFVKDSGTYIEKTLLEIIDTQPVACDLDMMLEQMEDYGKYKGIFRCEGKGFENYIPVSIAKQIVRGRGLGGVLGYMEDIG